MKDEYLKFCDNESDLPLFFRPWWLDVTAGEDNWGVVIEKKGEEVVACLPFAFESRYGFKLIKQPELTQYLGPWIRQTDCKYSRKLAREKEILNNLYAGLPEFDWYSQSWSYQYSNWLPLYWNNYRQTTRYTYRLNNLKNTEEIWSGFQNKLRSEIRKAENREKLVVRNDISIDRLFELIRQAFARQGKKVPYTKEYLYTIDKSAEEQGCRKIFAAFDESENCHAAAYIVWDENSAYYLLGGSDPEQGNSGAMSLCLWEAIQFSAKVTNSFDFEGSIIEPVEHFFRAFGAVQTPYSRISKTNSRTIRFYESLKYIAG